MASCKLMRTAMENEKSIPPKTDGLEQGNVDRTEAATLGKAVWSIRTKLQIEKRIDPRLGDVQPR